jgi:hypothetical protein
MDETKATFFVMSPVDLFEKNYFVFLNSPCYETPKKRVKKIVERIKTSNYFFLSAAANVRHFRPFFFAAPLAITHYSHPHTNGLLAGQRGLGALQMCAELSGRRVANSRPHRSPAHPRAAPLASFYGHRRRCS